MSNELECEHCGSPDLVLNVIVTRELPQRQQVFKHREYSCNECSEVTTDEE